MTGALSPQMLKDLATARSLARALPAPERDRGGLRVDTGRAVERRRDVFLDADAAFGAAAQAIDAPCVFLKACADPAAVLAVAPPRWTIQSVAWMTLRDPRCDDAEPRLPPGYGLKVTTTDGVARATVVAADRTLAGRRALYDDRDRRSLTALRRAAQPVRSASSRPPARPS